MQLLRPQNSPAAMRLTEKLSRTGLAAIATRDGRSVVCRARVGNGMQSPDWFGSPSKPAVPKTATLAPAPLGTHQHPLKSPSSPLSLSTNSKVLGNRNLAQQEPVFSQNKL